MRKNKTVGNLDKLWSHIDEALSEINLAMELVADMKTLEDEDELMDKIERFDMSELASIKYSIEEIIEAKNPMHFVKGE